MKVNWLRMRSANAELAYCRQYCCTLKSELFISESSAVNERGSNALSLLWTPSSIIAVFYIFTLFWVTIISFLSSISVTLLLTQSVC